MIKRQLKYRSLGLRGTLMAVALTFFFTGATPAIATVAIVLKQKASVESDVVYLGDIAEIQGAGKEPSAKLAGVQIQRSPRVGTSDVVQKERIVARLRSFGMTASDYRMTNGDTVIVTRRSDTISPKEVCGAVKSFIEKTAPWSKEQVKIKKLRLRHPVEVAPGRHRITVQAPKHTDWLGPIPFTVTIWTGDRVAKKLVVPATIEVWSDVLLASKPLGRGEPITKDKVKAVKMNLARAPSNAIMSLDQALGRRVNRSVAANSILRGDQIEMPPVVRRGDLVQVVAQSKAIRVSVKGIAKQNGGVGEHIRVQNVRSKRIIHAMVIDDQTVQVEF
jgi:flagella basal body P-ring formation protein FlgA